MTLQHRIKQYAHEIGFDLCAITTPDPPPHLDVYEAWIAEGAQGEMRYMDSESAIQKRADPHLVFPECRSIIVLATNYYQGHPPQQMREAPTGKIAQYAWGQDYHHILLARLKHLIQFIEREVGHSVQHRLYTDTGPLLERELAQRAGLGWIGKNTMLINPEIGSWTLLAEAMLDLDLSPDNPFTTDYCGSCTRCIDACPTEAILTDPRRVDSRRCISYWTIEVKGNIEPDTRANIGDWIFGCDVCQDVCPWNIRFASKHTDPAFTPRHPAPHPDLEEIVDLSQAEYTRIFRGSPIKRTKRSGLIRNATVALGNSKDTRATSTLSKVMCTEPEPMVREHAAWALEQLSNHGIDNPLQLAQDSPNGS